MGVFSLEKRKFSGDLVAVYNYMVKGFREDKARLFSEVHDSRTRGNKPKLKHGKFPLDIRKPYRQKGRTATTQTDCGTAITGGLQDSTGHGPEQSDLISPV